MSQIDYANPQAAKPDLGVIGGANPEADEGSGLSARQVATIPLTISVLVQLIYFVAYWIPETSAVPAHEWWLSQLSPLASTWLTSLGQPQVPVQVGQSGVPGTALLICGAVLLWLSRTPYWLGRTAMLVPAAVGALVWLGTGVSLAITGTFSSAAFGFTVMLAWVITAGYATYRCYLADAPAPVTKTWRAGLPLLIAYALVGPVPTAVGRFLFAPGIRDAAASLQANTVGLRLAALWTPSSVLLYLCGLLVGLCIWLAYQCWPPQRDLSFVGRVLALAVTIVLTGLLGWPANTLAERRVTALLYESPAKAVHFTCGALMVAQPDAPQQAPRPVLTLVVNGLTCRNVTTYSGYRQLATRTLATSVSPVKASTPDDQPIAGRIVAAQYGDVLVLAASNRLDQHASTLVGLRVSDAAELWQYSCGGRKALAVRFAGVPAGDQPTLGHQTLRERTPAVVVRCDGRQLAFDPLTGPPR